MSDTAFSNQPFHSVAAASFSSAVLPASRQPISTHALVTENPLFADAAVAGAGAAAAAVAAGHALQEQAPTPRRTDPELEQKVKRACERISENLHICANEPSLAFYRLAEHVRKALPPTVEKRAEVRALNQQLNGAYYDAEYGLETVRSMERAAPVIRNAQDLLKNAIFLQQQIKYEHQRSRSRKEPSMYQRFSAHITSVDIPDFSDLRETARETANRVESALSRGASTSSTGSGEAQQQLQQQQQPPLQKGQISRAASLSSTALCEQQQLKQQREAAAANKAPTSMISRSQSVFGPEKK